MSILYQGFKRPGQESKYNSTVYELLMTLAARVNASLKISKYLLVFYLIFKIYRNGGDICSKLIRGQSVSTDRKAI